MINTTLIVDDDPINNFISERKIKTTAFSKQVITFENPITALEYLKDLRESGDPFPEVVFLDINMPEMDAWEFLKELHEIIHDVETQTRFYILTSSIDSSDILKSKRYKEINDFLPKPLCERYLNKIKKEVGE